MTFFSRCDTSHRFEPSHRSTRRGRARPEPDIGPWAALAGFAEDLGILFRYAAGLDYYSRHRVQAKD